MPWLANGAGRPFYAVGGSWRALATLHMEQTNYPLHVMHGYAIPTEEAIDLLRQFLRKTKKLVRPLRASRSSPGRGARCCRTARSCSSGC